MFAFSALNICLRADFTLTVLSSLTILERVWLYDGFSNILCLSCHMWKMIFLLQMWHDTSELIE